MPDHEGTSDYLPDEAEMTGSGDDPDDDLVPACDWCDEAIFDDEYVVAADKAWHYPCWLYAKPAGES